MDDIAVSIVCITYNHERYIVQAMESFISQKTNFKYEIIVHDDHSTDDTMKFVNRYKADYEDMVIVIEEDENKYTKGLDPTELACKYARGRYVAFCEGDDFWCDENKLQIQYDLLEEDKNAAFSVHKTRIVDKEGHSLNALFPKIEIESKKLNQSDYLYYELKEAPWLFQQSSLFTRNILIQEYYRENPEFRSKYCVGDLPLIMFLLTKGHCIYTPIIMSCYRKNSGGLMTQYRHDSDREVEYYEKMISGHREYDKYTHREFHSLFEYAEKVFRVQQYKHLGTFEKIFSTEYSEVYHNQNKSNKILFWLGRYFPKTCRNVFLFAHYHNKNK